MRMTSLAALELVSAHLGQGRLDRAAHARLHALSALLPEGSGGAGGELWRALIIPTSQLDALLAGEQILLEAADFECWSLGRDGVRNILRLRSWQAQQRSREDGIARSAVLISRVVPAEDRLLDVEAYLRAAGPQYLTGGAWWHYASREREVIVRRTGGCGRVLPHELREHWDVGAPDLFAPELNEPFEADDDGVRTVDEVLGVNECGCFEVRSGDVIYPLIFEGTHFGLGGEARRLAADAPDLS